MGGRMGKVKKFSVQAVKLIAEKPEFLTETEWQLMKEYGACKEVTLEEIGEKYRLTKSEVRDFIWKGMRKILKKAKEEGSKNKNIKSKGGAY